MKKLLVLILITVMALLGFTACTDGNSNGGNGGGGSDGGGGTTNPPATAASDTLIAYFSCTNTTEGVAKHIQAETKGTLYEIVPEVPYTEDDLKYYTDCRADKEQKDNTARPAISGNVENIEKYDVVFLGYPIWHGQAPKIIYTFLESYDFSGKTIIPFCTSASSGIGSSDTNLHTLAPFAEWISGKRFPSGTSQNTIAEWIESLNMKFTENIMYLTINGNKVKVTLEDNSSTNALVEILKKGDIVYTADDYGGFEKVGALGHTLPTSDTELTTQAGDVILYLGSNIVLFYGSNSWEYTRLGRMEGYSVSELRTYLCADDGPVQVTISLE
ncbi:MAG: hypothetical protein K2O28_04030 [Clostridia bacterium]|nr:hypothetical protein [Clostridia bacterium]